MDSVLELVQDYKEIILLMFSLPLIKNLITFMSSTSIERQFYSKEKKYLFEFINIFFTFIIIPTLIYYLFSLELNRVTLFFNKYFGVFGLILLMLCLVIIINKGFIPNLRKKWIRQIPKFRQSEAKLNSTAERCLILIIIILAMIVFGTLNIDIILTDLIDDLLKPVILLLFIFFELYIIYMTLMWGTNIKFTKPLLVTINMDDGNSYENYYIYYPSDRNFILIGDNIESHLCTQPILINVDKISSCTPIQTEV